jgi:SAM-dependent methyltransferase
MPTLYSSLFEKFLRHTNEKEVLARGLNKIIHAHGVGSLLDIGAGNGELAKRIAPLVHDYTAVESDPEHIQGLLNHGLSVHPHRFPCQLPRKGTYDMALAAYVIMETFSEQAEFIRQAIQCVRPDGIFVMVMYCNSDDGRWSQLLQNLDLQRDKLDATVFAKLMASYVPGRRVTEERVQSRLSCTSREELLECLAFAFGNGNHISQQRFLRAIRQDLSQLNGCQRGENEFTFFFDHYLLIART